MITKNGKTFVIKEIWMDNILNVYCDGKPYSLIAVDFPIDVQDKMSYGYQHLDAMDEIPAPAVVSDKY
jgi:hypothetical protein